MLSEISIPGSGSSGTSFSGSQYRVLLADDDAGVRTSLAALLDGDGFLTEHASGGQEVLSLLRNFQQKSTAGTLAVRPFDFLVLDVHMPDLTGVEVLRRIRSEYRWRFPALFVSGEASVELKRDVEEVGGFALLPKPVEPDLFRSRIRDLVRTLLEN
ncbi:MAG: response regulator [Planctomycetota bacterium]|nr:response regulator [Planctomycetota bacterium]